VALFEIADNALIAKDYLDPQLIKTSWLSGTLARTNELHRLTNPYPIDCVGWPEYSIFQQLEFHSTFEIESQCDCGTFYHRDFQLEVEDLKEIDILGNPQELHRAKLPICEGCNDYRVLRNLTPCPSNWLLSFKTRTKTVPFSPILADLPRYVQMGQITYKLEYVTYIVLGPNVNHAVSVQLIRHHWYKFNSQASPYFQRWRKPTFDEPNATVDRIVYFRVV